RAGLAAAGGIGGVLAGRQAGSSAATTTDDSGRTAGEDGAAATTIGRFAAGMGPVGQALSTGIGVMAAVGGTAAAMGADQTNQMGVGHNNFPPDYSRRGVRAGSGQSGYDDGATSEPTNPDDPIVDNDANGLDGGGWGGPHAAAVHQNSSPASSPPPGRMPSLPSAGGGSTGGGAASSAEAADVAEMAAL
ncbi:MAG TPA: hypothetical protein PJ992_04585, partial [Arachnia sp.]|nr:hypothetical protein [Arachnia sp.]